MLSTASMHKVRVNTRDYNYDGYSDAEGNKWILKPGKCVIESAAYKLAKQLGVLAPEVKRVKHTTAPWWDGDYHLVYYYDNATVLHNFVERISQAAYDDPNNPFTNINLTRSQIQSAIKMVAFDAIALDNDRHSGNYMSTNEQFIAIDMEDAFNAYANEYFSPIDIASIIGSSDLAQTLFYTKYRNGWCGGAENCLNIDPKNHMTHAEKVEFIKRIRKVSVANIANAALRSNRGLHHDIVTIRKNVKAQIEHTANEMAEWLGL